MSETQLPIDLIGRDRLSPAFKTARASSRDFERGIENLKTDIDRLRGSYDPVFRANQQYAQQQRQIRLALANRVIQEREAKTLLEQVARAQTQAVAIATRSVQGLRRSGGATRNFGVIAQQAGFQVGDFATQVASGQRAVVAFTQQAPQFLGFFGPIGAVAGAATAILGAFAVATLATRDATRNAKDANDRYKTSLEDVRDRLIEATEGERGLARAIAQRGLDASIKQIDEAREAFFKADAQLQKFTKRYGDFTGRVAENETGEFQALIVKFQSLQKAANDARNAVNDRVIDAENQSRRIADGSFDPQTRGRRDRATEARRNAQDNLKNLREQAAAIRISAHELNVVRETQNLINGGFAGGAMKAREIAEATIQQREEIEKVIQARRDDEREQQRIARERQRVEQQLPGFRSDIINDPFEQELARLQEQFERRNEFNQRAYDLQLIQEEEFYRNSNAIAEKYAQQREDLELRRQQVILGNAETTFGGLADIARTFGGEQSKVFKALFAAEKAFAIAQAAINIQVALSRALTLPFPANLAQFAVVATQGATIASSIQSIAGGGFQRGGFTGNTGVGQVAGVVHGREFVMNADATSRNRQLFEYINRTGQMPEPIGGAPRIVINNMGTPQTMSVQSVSRDEVRLIAQDEVRRTGPSVAVEAVSRDAGSNSSRVRQALRSRSNLQERRS